MKDLGSLSYFLALEVPPNSGGYCLTQAKYATDLLSRAGLSDSKIADTPIKANFKLTPTASVPFKDPTLYRQLVRSLIYPSVTRLDIAYAVHILSQFTSTPCTGHYAATLYITHYVKGTLFHGLLFPFNTPLELRVYSHSDWADDRTDRRTTTGFQFFLRNSLISWRSKQQTVVARSSIAAGYCALADTTSVLAWFRWLLADMGAT